MDGIWRDYVQDPAIGGPEEPGMRWLTRLLEGPSKQACCPRCSASATMPAVPLLEWELRRGRFPTPRRAGILVTCYACRHTYAIVRGEILSPAGRESGLPAASSPPRAPRGTPGDDKPSTRLIPDEDMRWTR